MMCIRATRVPWLVLLLAVVACASTKTDAPSKTAVSARPAPAGVPVEGLAVLDAGKEPRIAIRYAPAVGTAFVCDTRMETFSEDRDGSNRKLLKRFAMTFDLAVLALEADGRIRVKWTITAADVYFSDIPNVTSNEIVKEFIGKSGEKTITANGVTLDPIEGELFQYGLHAPVPQEAVGVGARWVYTAPIGDGSKRGHGTFEVTSIEGGVVHVKAGMTIPGVPAIVEATIVYDPGVPGPASLHMGMPWIDPIGDDPANRMTMTVDVRPKAGQK
jgi:hypothetical protein